jgi:elongation factor 2 kinase
VEVGNEKAADSPKKLRSSKSKEASIPRPPPDWASLPSEEAILHTYSLDSNSWTNTKVTIQIEDTAFARGSLRYAYHVNGLAAFGNDSNTCYVAKMSIDPYEARESYFEDVKMQMLCKQYANKYNQYNPPKTIDFIKAWLLELSSRPDKPLAGVERFIHGAYRKHNNNFGFVSDDERNTPQAFSHFTYEASQHELLICDIQGVADCYTDPQIHNQDGRGFGKGNMGQRGLTKFLSTHRCNAICRYLKLPVVNAKVTDLGTVPAERLMAYTKVQVTQFRYQAENTVVGLPKLKVKPNVSADDEQTTSVSCCCVVS